MSFIKKNLFSILSWVVTLAIVAGILFLACRNKEAFAKTAPPTIIEATPTAVENSTSTNTSPTSESTPTEEISSLAIRR